MLRATLTSLSVCCRGYIRTGDEAQAPFAAVRAQDLQLIISTPILPTLINWLCCIYLYFINRREDEFKKYGDMGYTLAFGCLDALRSN